jgi:hypothetical protein
MVQRIERGWFTRDGKIIITPSHDQPPLPPESTPNPTKQTEVAEVDLDHATAVLEATAGKTSLKSLRKAALVALCTAKLRNAANYDYNKDTVDTLLAKLTTWVCQLPLFPE